MGLSSAWGGIAEIHLQSRSTWTTSPARVISARDMSRAERREYLKHEEA